MSEFITPDLFYSMFITGTKSLEEKKAYINELNVFPVPDGDTGTNMALTLNSAIKELSLLGNFYSLEEAGKAVSNGALKGARGNSGVIMSQLIRGFSKGLSGLERLDKADISYCMKLADEMARKAVSNPKEGTILTVARAAAAKAKELCESDITMEAFLKEILAYSDYTLSRTPEMLEVLKEAGVVDSGGQGLVEFLRGAYEAFTGKAAEYVIEADEIPKISFQSHAVVDSSDIETSNIKFTYCTEFIVVLNEALNLENKVRFKKYLEELGDSLVFVSTDEMIKIHVHTNHPGLAFEKGLEYGSLTSMKIDNMKEEHKEKLEIEEQSRADYKDMAFVSVCTGDGIKEIFKGIGAEKIVEGGQTMNPSAEDLAAAVKGCAAKNVFVLPNNKNVILTARAAKELCRGINVYVIPTKNIAQGICAIINYLPALSAEQNAAHMSEEIENVKVAEITYAIRDSETEGIKIKKGDYMAISNGHIACENADLLCCVRQTIEELFCEDTETVSIYYGEDVDEQTASEAAEIAEEICPDADIELVCGGQSVYEFIISLE